MKTAHELVLEELNLNPGDKVVVLGKISSYLGGWCNGWLSPKMDRCINGVFTVESVSDAGVNFVEDTASWCAFPAFCLEVVSRANNKKKYTFNKKKYTLRESQVAEVESILKELSSE